MGLKKGEKRTWFSLGYTGHTPTKEQKDRMSERMSGKNNPMYGIRLIGRIFSPETKKLMSDSMRKAHRENPDIAKRKGLAKLEELNPMWKGDEVGYTALHNWIKSRKLMPKFCECCRQSKPYDLANISGEYKRDLDDWEWLCRRCHMVKDGRLVKLVIRNKYPTGISYPL
jgi:hypothetical protein